MTHRHVPVAVLAAVAIAGAPAAASAAGPEAAIAVLHPTKGNDAHGVLTFHRQSDGSVTVEAHVSGLAPGVHAYHVHVWGDCSAPDGTSAGTHFNFVGSSLNPPSDIHRITGDLGELRADASGEASASGPVENARLDGPKSIIGRAVVVHAKANDPASPPIGAAGARVACGVIGIAKPPNGNAGSGD